MSLVGNLEDLGLGEILQIVSLSRKSGVLSLFSRGREGKIVFRQGQVIRATIDGQQSHLGQMLLKNGVITDASLRKALTLQEQEGGKERLGDLLTTALFRALRSSRRGRPPADRKYGVCPFCLVRRVVRFRVAG